MQSCDYDPERVRETARKAAERDHDRGKPRPDARLWAPEYREAYDEERRRLDREDFRRPAGVDPNVLDVRPERPEVQDTIDELAEAIGRRAAWKLVGEQGAPGTDQRAHFQRVADVIEAEVRSSWGTPKQDDVKLPFGYGEAVQIVSAIVEAQTTGRSPSELETLYEVRRKFLLAIGLL